jgi:omega-6 fatty acid desaturase (delta-12 desaturase)
MDAESQDLGDNGGLGAYPTSIAEWRRIVAAYQKPSAWRAGWQVVSTLGAYALVWAGLYFFVSTSWFPTLLLVVLAGALLVRLFILFHDCTHDSFFPSRRANMILGFVTGVLTFTPFRHWRWEHSQHHATAGDLDRRGTGDIWTMTVEEYRNASRWRRLAYRLARHPIVLFLIAPVPLFLVWQRFPAKGSGRAERRSVWWTDLAIIGMVAGMSWLFGFPEYLLLQLGTLLIGGAAGVWLFYVQHQFEGVTWARRAEWDFVAAALEGSSFYRLPRVLQWFSGSIGYHHIHHLNPRIPNYNLERCHRAVARFYAVPPVTLFGSLRSLGFRLWDERGGRLVGFGHLRKQSGAVEKNAAPAPSGERAEPDQREKSGGAPE